MRRLAIVRMVLFLACVSRLVPGQVAPEDEPVVISEGKSLPSPLQMTQSSGSYQIGSPEVMCLGILNPGHGKLVVRIPFLPMITGEPFLAIRVMNEDGAEAVSYLGEEAPPFELGEDPPDYPVFLTISPGEYPHVTSPEFVLWEPGEYAYRIELRNRISKQRVMTLAKGLPITRVADVPIRNVWVGRVVFEGKLAVEEGASEKLKKTLGSLRADALDPRKPILDAYKALTALVEMRHIYATDTLMAIEKETRVEKVYHTVVLKALCDIAYHGTGYRALRLFAELALDHNATPLDRVLCVHVLATFGRSKTLSHKGRVFHVVGAGERELAQKALAKLRAGTGDLPADLANALEAAERN